MKYVYLNKNTVTSLDDLYSRFSEGFNFPAYFGANLDALYDCLTESTADRLVLISDRDYLNDLLGPAFSRVCHVLVDAARETPSLRIYEIKSW